MDTEGTPIQELAALEMKSQTREIVSVFHGYAKTELTDSFARNFVHGLNPLFLKQEGLDSESDLIAAFKDWLSTKSYSKLLSNGPDKECKALSIKVENFPLLPWRERKNEMSHQLALRFKKLQVAILGRQCLSTSHSSFICAPSCKNDETYEAKNEHGHHCALYDSYELYLHYAFYQTC